MGTIDRGGVVLAVALLAGAGLASRAASAADAPAHPWYEEITVDGFASTSYSYNFDRPLSRTNAFHVFDFDHNTFKVDVVELVMQHAAVEPRQDGFRIDLEAGGSIPRVSAAAGLFRDPATGHAQDFDLQQAYGTWVAPVGSGLRVDAGKFVTHLGLEVIEGYDGWNDNATHSFLFGYAIPFTHTGVRASYAFSPRVSALAMVANGWDVATDNNGAKTVGAQLALTPAPPWKLFLNAIVGAERADSGTDLRTVLDIVASFAASPRVTLGFNLDHGSEDGAAPTLGPAPAGTATWTGAAACLRFAATERLALAIRGETFDDRDGARTGLTQTLTELTLTPELRLAPRLILRGDLRVDSSTHDTAFPRRDGFASSQTTVLVNALTWF